MPHLSLEIVHYIPMEFLVEFCSDNRHLNVLELAEMCFNSDNGEDVSSVGCANTTLTLGKLILKNISFENPTMASKFANFAHATSVSALSLGDITCRYYDDEEGGMYYGNNILEEATTRIVSELVKPLSNP